MEQTSDFPIRDITHIIERKAIEILNEQLPKEWIIREMTERDYGIDLYVEIVNEDKKVAGDLLAIQVKGKEKIEFNEQENFTFYSIKNSTLNYWLNLPVPVFFVVVCIDSKKSFWCNVKNDHRSNKFISSKGNTVRITIPKAQDLVTANKFVLHYIREKRWPAVENAIENSLMFFNSLGPFILICRRKPGDEYCSTTIQYLLIQHFEYYRLLSRYILSKKPKLITHWYNKHTDYQKSLGKFESATFSFELINEIIDDFISEYREAIRICNLLVIKHQEEYFKKRFPYLYAHLKLRPLAFVESDWYARYYNDEYENDTRNIEKLFFEDFTEYDDWDLIDDVNI